MDAFGSALGGAQLRECSTLQEIQTALVEWRESHPEEPRVTGGGWLFDAVGDEHPTAAPLDAVLPDIPVYLDANDLHSVWVNSAALDEMGIDGSTPDPVGGRVARYPDGTATGLLYESAGVQYGWEFLEAARKPDDLIADLDRAFATYLQTGVTGVTDMALTETEVSTFRTILARDGRLPFPVTGHVLMTAHDDPVRDLAQVDRVVELRDELASCGEDEWFRIAGVKFIMDGVIDACTATMCHPYADGTNADPIWAGNRALPVAVAADAVGLQIAMHAIGDRTSEIALDVLEQVRQRNADGPRHRVEHLETVTDRTIRRMAALGVVASMQPVHCDPAILDNWKAVLGDDRQEEGFPWHKFRAAGIPLTLGTDAPTAPHDTLPNLYIALTGGSSLNPSLPPYHPERVFSPADALTALTAGGAYAGGMENRCGRIRVGQDANFIELDLNPLESAPSDLLAAGDQAIRATYVLGREAYRRSRH